MTSSSLDKKEDKRDDDKVLKSSVLSKKIDDKVLKSTQDIKDLDTPSGATPPKVRTHR